MTQHPYEQDLAGADPLVSLAASHAHIMGVVGGWGPDDFERPYGTGKWTGRELLLHLVQCELVFGQRARFALTTPGFTVVPFDQDDWMPLDRTADAAAALTAYRGLRALNLAFFRSLSPEQLAHTCTHPAHGTIDVRWILSGLAGHERHHLPHVDALAALRRS